MEVDIGISPLRVLYIFYNYALSMDFINASINHGIYHRWSHNQGDVCQCRVIFITHVLAQYFHFVSIRSM